ncbi:MAG: Nuclease [Rhizobacter sp.]|nr:Nuclease [Rhizobacter sp.]
MTTSSRLHAFFALVLTSVALLVPPSARAWGHAGHVGISRLAIEALPDELPAFLRSKLSVRQIGEIGAEPDVSRSAGLVTSTNGRVTTAPTVHDAERDPGHFLDVDDDGVVLGGAVRLDALPATREAFDTAQRSATKPGAQTQYGGYLPYAMIDGFQQVRKDFGLWRALNAGLAAATTEPDRAYFRFHLDLREQLIVRDIGVWSHFVADASQPMHVSIHFNGWGNYANPNGYATAALHSPFEASFVRSFVDFGLVAARMRPYGDRGVATVERRVPLYIAESLTQVLPLYEAAKTSGPDGNNNYRTAQPAELEVVIRQLAAGASELRDQIVDAWRQSAQVAVGQPLVRVSDIEAGTVKVTRGMFGSE